MRNGELYFNIKQSTWIQITLNDTHFSEQSGLTPQPDQRADNTRSPPMGR